MEPYMTRTGMSTGELIILMITDTTSENAGQ